MGDKPDEGTVERITPLERQTWHFVRTDRVITLVAYEHERRKAEDQPYNLLTQFGTSTKHGDWRHGAWLAKGHVPLPADVMSEAEALWPDTRGHVASVPSGHAETQIAKGYRLP